MKKIYTTPEVKVMTITTGNVMVSVSDAGSDGSGAMAPRNYMFDFLDEE